jgi:uncharacterized repeat protein (TIGR03803 family)
MDGYLYGVTQYATESLPGGSFYEMSGTGRFGVLYQFQGESNGDAFPNPPIQATDGNFYGTTQDGGTDSKLGDGIFFKITPDGKETTLYIFCSGQANCADGSGPNSVIQGSDGNFYGTAGGGGTNSNNSICGMLLCGTLFKITPTGELTTIYNFCSQTNCADGARPIGMLLQATNGILYGTTSNGGGSANCSVGCGTIFSVDIGLPPFVQANPNVGKTGGSIGILGNNLTGATSVTFNGTAATFSVVSSNFIKATVPTGATSGTIEVTTPSGTLSSKAAFQVVP